jgi:hypothetical protein
VYIEKYLEVVVVEYIFIFIPVVVNGLYDSVIFRHVVNEVSLILHSS